MRIRTTCGTVVLFPTDFALANAEDNGYFSHLRNTLQVVSAGDASSLGFTESVSQESLL
jgi:hypothetical protein